MQIGIEPVPHDKRYEIADEYLRVLYKYVGRFRYRGTLMIFLSSFPVLS